MCTTIREMRLTYEWMTHFVDVLAVPCFFLATLYFIGKPHKSLLEVALMIFVGIGLFVDSLLTSRFLGSAAYVLMVLALTLIIYIEFRPVINKPLM